MTRTTPFERTFEHKSWHRFDKGLCLYCGWHCVDCPIGVATCKCKGMSKEELADIRLREETLGITSEWE